MKELETLDNGVSQDDSGEVFDRRFNFMVVSLMAVHWTGSTCHVRTTHIS